MTWLLDVSCSWLHNLSTRSDTSKGTNPGYPGQGRREDPSEAPLWGKGSFSDHAPTRVSCMALKNIRSLGRSHQRWIYGHSDSTKHDTPQNFVAYDRASRHSGTCFHRISDTRHSPVNDRRATSPTVLFHAVVCLPRASAIGGAVETSLHSDRIRWYHSVTHLPPRPHVTHDLIGTS